MTVKDGIVSSSDAEVESRLGVDGLKEVNTFVRIDDGFFQ